LLALDTESQLATFGAGTPGPAVEALLNARGYTLGHFPQSFELSTLGGWVATRSSGQQSLRYGRIEQLFAGGRLETLEGTLDIPAFPASSAGPDLREWVLGSEGRLGIVTEAVLRVAPLPAVEVFPTFFLQGQNCMAGTRILVHEAVHDELLAGLKAFAAAMVVGHGLDPATQIGPLISAPHGERVLGHIERGLAEGATLVCGGARLARPGFFVAPTIFADCTPAMALVREEIFGPVMAVQRLATDDLDAIARQANDSVYGLSGSVWTRSLASAHKLVARIRAGQVSVNCHGAIGTNIPFGGYGQSGWGREFGREGLDSFLETKAVTLRL